MRSPDRIVRCSLVDRPPRFESNGRAKRCVHYNRPESKEVCPLGSLREAEESAVDGLASSARSRLSVPVAGLFDRNGSKAEAHA